MEDKEEPAVCGKDCHEAHYQGYNNPEDNSFMEAHLENEVSCWDCHSGKEVKDKSEDPHGDVTVENCLVGCHEDVNWLLEAPQVSLGENLIWHPYTDDGTNKDELKNIETCINCHDPRADSFGLGAETCILCHYITTDELDQHGQDTCSFSSCHQEGPDLRVNKTGHVAVEGHCNRCHNKQHPQEALVAYDIEFGNTTFGANAPFCSACHEDAFAVLIESGKNHKGEACTQCHPEHDNIEECTTCHTENDIPHPAGELYEKCSSCHITGGHDPALIEFSSFFSETLSENFCSSTSCHAADVYEEIDSELGGELHGQEELTKDCLSCHLRHISDVACFSCHDAEKEPEHDISGPYDNCSRCHINGHDNENITFTKFNVTELGTSFCGDCHEDTPQEITDASPGHSPIACHNCHENARGDAVDCTSCHSTLGMANPPGHSTEAPFDECGQCHDSGHNPRQISSFNVTYKS